MEAGSMWRNRSDIQSNEYDKFVVSSGLEYHGKDKLMTSLTLLHSCVSLNT